MKFLKSAPYKTFLDNAEFHVLDLSPKRDRPKIYENIHLVPLYTITWAKIEGKYKNIKDLLYFTTFYQFTENIYHSKLKISFLKNEKKVRNNKNYYLET